MEPKQAAQIAKDYVTKLFDGQEAITNLNLEEVEYDLQEESWKITLGFSRPFQSPANRSSEILDRFGAGPQLRRSIKVLTVTDHGEVRSMKDRQEAYA